MVLDGHNHFQFFILVPWLIYVANVILGIGAAVIWTAQVTLIMIEIIILIIIVLINNHLDCTGTGNLQLFTFTFTEKFMAIVSQFSQGNLLANNSDPTTITRNSGVFWAMNMSSSFIGNTLAFFLFKVGVINIKIILTKFISKVADVM